MIDSEKPRTPTAFILAPLWKRSAAKLIDYGFIFALVTALLFLLPQFGSSGVQSLIIIGIIGAIWILFNDALPVPSGKSFLGLKVISETGEPCTFFKSFVRNILPGMIGPFDLIPVLGENRQRLGDILASTVVVEERHRSEG